MNFNDFNCEIGALSLPHRHHFHPFPREQYISTQVSFRYIFQLRNCAPNFIHYSFSLNYRTHMIAPNEDIFPNCVRGICLKKKRNEKN